MYIFFSPVFHREYIYSFYLDISFRFLFRICVYEECFVLFSAVITHDHATIATISKSTNPANNISMHTRFAWVNVSHRDIQIYWHLRARCPRVSRRSRSFTWLARSLVSSRVWSREVLPISSARDPLSCATCDINPASVSSLSRTEYRRTWSTAIYTSVPYSHRTFVA